MIDTIKRIIADGEFDFYGLRVDDYKYNVGDICKLSHQYFQDPVYNEDEELLYPYTENGYDAGELNGTCCVGIEEDNIEKAIKLLKQYIGDNVYIIGGDIAEEGNDRGELIIKNAKVLYVF